MIFLIKIISGKIIMIWILFIWKRKLQDINNKKFQEVTASVAMEKVTFIRCMLDTLNVMDLLIRVVSTDSYLSKKKLMKTDESFRHILHQIDF